MTKRIFTYGVGAGLIVSFILFPLVLVFGCGGGTLGMAIGYLTMLVALSLIAVAVKRQRDAGGGVIGFWPAFGMGLAISAVASVVYVALWDVSLALMHQDFAAIYAAAQVDAAREAGTSGPALAKVEAEMAAFRADYADPLWRWPMTFAEIFPVGVLVSLVTAALMRHRSAR